MLKDETNDLFKQTIISPFESNEHGSGHVVAIYLLFNSNFLSSFIFFSLFLSVSSSGDSLTYRTNNICYRSVYGSFSNGAIDFIATCCSMQPFLLHHAASQLHGFSMRSQCICSGLTWVRSRKEIHLILHGTFCEKWTHFYQASVPASLPSLVSYNLHYIRKGRIACIFSSPVICHLRMVFPSHSLCISFFPHLFRTLSFFSTLHSDKWYLL